MRALRYQPWRHRGPRLLPQPLLEIRKHRVSVLALLATQEIVDLAVGEDDTEYPDGLEISF